MKLLISSPAFGGMLHRSYVASWHRAVTQATNEGLLEACEVLWQGSESLIPRGRNMDALHLLERKFDKLLSIDTDIDFSYEDFKRIITSEKDLVGGIYPLKCFPVVANFNPIREHREEFFSSGRGIDYDALLAFREKYADPETGEVEVEHVPTGFMCVTQKVFAKLSETVEVYRSFQPDTGTVKGYFEFYPCGARKGAYESEDWAFCRLAREAGFIPHINTKVLLGHTGQHTFRLGQFFGQVDQSGETRKD
jgi:hypothetical protein